MLSRISHVQFFVILCTVAHQGPLSMGFSRQEHWRSCLALLKASFSLVSHGKSHISNESVSRSVVSDSLQPNGLWTCSLPLPWNSPGKNTEVGSHFLLHGVFPIQGSNPGLPHCRQILYLWATRGDRDTNRFDAL